MELKTSKTFSKGPTTKISNKKLKNWNCKPKRKEDWYALFLGEREK
jgi:hypothetical protein